MKIKTSFVEPTYKKGKIELQAWITHVENKLSHLGLNRGSCSVYEQPHHEHLYEWIGITMAILLAIIGVFT